MAGWTLNGKEVEEGKNQQQHHFNQHPSSMPQTPHHHNESRQLEACDDDDANMVSNRQTDRQPASQPDIDTHPNCMLQAA